MAQIFQQYAILLAILSVGLATLLRADLLSLYTSDAEIITQINVVWIPYMVFVFCIAINMVVSGALNSVSSLVNQLAYGFT